MPQLVQYQRKFTETEILGTWYLNVQNSAEYHSYTTNQDNLKLKEKRQSSDADKDFRLI